MTKSNEAERAIRSAALALAEAIAQGGTAGLTVVWPGRPEDLPAIAISATAQASAAPGRIVPKPAKLG